MGRGFESLPPVVTCTSASVITGLRTSTTRVTGVRGRRPRTVRTCDLWVMSPTSYQYKITRLTHYWSQQTTSGVTPVGITLSQPRVYHNNLPPNNAWDAARYVLPGVTRVRVRRPKTQGFSVPCSTDWAIRWTQGLKIPCSTLIRTPELQIRNLLLYPTDLHTHKPTDLQSAPFGRSVVWYESNQGLL